MNTPVIMLVEDDAGIREAYTDVLQDEGYIVRGYANGLEAINALEHEQAPTLILLDWMMPVMTGEQFIRSDCGKEISAATPVIVISAVASRLDKVPGIKEYLNKPVDLDRLLKTVSRYCGTSVA